MDEAVDAADREAQEQVNEAAPVEVARLEEEEEGDEVASQFSAATDTDYVPDDAQSTAIIKLMLDNRFTSQENRDGEVLSQLRALMEEGDPPYREKFKNAQFEGRFSYKGLIHIAAMNRYTGFVKYLVTDCGFNPDSIDDFAGSALHYASEYANAEMVNFILSTSTASMNEQDTEAMTPLHYAVLNNNYLNAIELLNKGANIRITEKSKLTILDYLSMYPPDEEQMGDYNAFLETLKGNPDICEDINRVRDDGNTLLIEAVVQNNIDLIRWIVSIGCPDAVNFPDKYGNTPLHNACKYSSDGTMEELLSIPGLDIERKNAKGQTPLLYAAELGGADRVAKLIIKGAKIDTKDAEGKTPLDAVDTLFSRGQIMKIQTDVAQADMRIETLTSIEDDIDALRGEIKEDSKILATTTGEERESMTKYFIAQLADIQAKLEHVLNPDILTHYGDSDADPESMAEVNRRVAVIEEMFKTRNDAAVAEAAEQSARAAARVAAGAEPVPDAKVHKPFESPQQKVAYILRELLQVGASSDAFLDSARRRRAHLEEKKRKVNMKGVLTLLLSVSDKDQPAEVRATIEKIVGSMGAKEGADLALVNNDFRKAYMKTVTDESRKQRGRLLKLMRGKRDLSDPGEGPEGPSGKRRRTEEGGSRRQRGAKSKAATAKAAKKRHRRGTTTTYKSKPKTGKRGKLRTVKRRK